MEELELRQYWHIIRRHWMIVIGIPIVAIIVSGILSFFVIRPQYEADTTLLVNQSQTSAEQAGLQYDSIMANQALVNTYSAIIKSASIEENVIQQLNLPYTVAQLDKMITVSSPTQSQVIDVKVIGPSEAQAVSIANALATDFQKRAARLMDVENVQIVDRAVNQPGAKPVKPNKKLNLAIALILGLLVGIGIAFLLEYLDNRIRSAEDAQRLLELPVLGTISDYSLER
ncbi:Capsular polysaccharide biosynthesis protein [Alicyclobacillus hesperidum]|uniref:Capsular polysaccharide biosynthesis protein n=1 Tax=Alicyclobacillus hesperidum TaxID=89784 RepID=A0A1H2RAZ0_9BACL|nr:Wzz/FepE/Etk N-terminal domain-containing protein [Alicyclobacillus hesperidum]SDW16602.1 Capsular polysaccharide biosynthesis protein [Alicyclobacillus hesperidum]